MPTLGTLVPFADGVFIGHGPASIVFMKLTATMTVLRLRDGSLLLHTPFALTEERRAMVEALGRVSHLYAPNLFHHLHVGEWSKAFPQARVHAPSGLRKKRPDLRIDRAIGNETEPAFEGVIDEVRFSGCRLHETVLLYRPANTLVCADLVQNVGQPQGGWTKFYTKTMGFYDRVALSRVLQWTVFSDREAASNSLREVLALPFDRLIVGHGAPLESGAKEALRSAYAWLDADLAKDADAQG